MIPIWEVGSISYVLYYSSWELFTAEQIEENKSLEKNGCEVPGGVGGGCRET